MKLSDIFLVIISVKFAYISLRTMKTHISPPKTTTI